MTLALAAAVICGTALPAAAAGGAPAASGEASASFEEPSSYTARIVLAGGKAQINGSGAVLEDGVLNITAPGVYRLEGALDGSIHVAADAADTVRLVLCGLTAEGGEYALYAEGCSDLELTLVSDNRLSCGKKGDGGAALYSGAPLTVNGPGSLALTSEGNGVESRGGLIMNGGSLVVDAGGDGLHVRDTRFTEGGLAVNGGSLAITAGEDALDAESSILVTGGTVTADAGGDGLKAAALRIEGGWVSLNAADDGADAGTYIQTGGSLVLTAAGNGLKAEQTVLLEGGTLDVTSEGDAIQAVADLTITGGEVSVLSGGGGGLAMGKTGNDGFGFGFRGGSSSVVYTALDHSAKALKSDGTISVTGGTLRLDCYDDALHAAGLITVGACAMDIYTNDDAVHSDTEIVIDGGDVLIRECFEGVEAETVTMNDGNWVVRCVNDGVNCSGSGGFGWGSSACFTMNGGRLDITCIGVSSNIGDGVDSNGTVVITGGELTAGTLGGTMENGMDVGTGLYVYGGILAATGNSGMQEGASSSSTQCTATLSLSGNVPAGTEYVVTDEAGNVIYAWTPEDAANGVVISHPDFVLGGSYTLTAGSQSTSFTFDSTSYSARGGFGRW